MQNYLEAGNLQRALDKSQLLLVHAGKPIPEEQGGGHPPHIQGWYPHAGGEAGSDLDLHLQRDGGAKYAVDRLVETTTQVMRMMSRITSHRHRLKKSDLIQLTQALVVSRITYAASYLSLLSRGKGKTDVIIRKEY